MTENINFIFVFLEGIFSFFSPCILPLLPVYMGYLAGNTKTVKEETGESIYPRKTVLINTILFVIGISFAFFVLGMTFSALGNFFQKNKEILTKISGIIIILLGIIQLGIFKIPFFQKEHRLKWRGNLQKMNPLLAFALGFTFSFAWTPCVGPALASVLVLASSNASVVSGNLLVFVYTLGFVIPFLLLGVFTTSILNFLKRKQKLFGYVVKIAAIILILMGILTLTGGISGINTFFSKWNKEEPQAIVEEEKQKEKESVSKESEFLAFSVKDQYGKEHNLSEYQGKVVLLNFWTTWCTYCKQEMPDLQSLYEEFGKNEGEVIILGVANPSTSNNRNAQDVSKEEIIKFLEENSISYPVLMDETGEIFEKYRISAYPTTAVLDKRGEMFKYAMGIKRKEKIKDYIIEAGE